jgi:hypothetical protein
MGLDARLADGVILALAARRAKERQTTAPKRTVKLRTIYYDMLTGEEEEGESFVYELPPQPGDRPC